MRSNHAWTVLMGLVLLLTAPLALVDCGSGGSATASATARQPTASTAIAPAASPGQATTGGSVSPTASPAASPGTAAATPTPTTATVEVRISDFRFDPPTVTVATGTTVVWTNLGPTAHTTTSKQGVWDSAILLKGQSFRFTFREPGTYPYWCSLHPEMLGTVVVK